jgi:hypothetical protein
MQKVLVVYYTQTGQLKSAVQATLQPLIDTKGTEVDFLEIKTKKNYPYPWSYMEFFDIFPETVHGIPCELEAFSINTTKHYDLVVIAYQPWFLSICVPINSFMQSEQAKQLLANKPVLTIIACRNMWLGGQEKMKLHLKNLNAKLVGNITFVDRAANLVSLVTVLAFVLKGVKEKFMGIFPKYGVADADLKNNAPIFGNIILNHLQKNNFDGMQTQLLEKGAVIVKPNLMLMEGRGRALFPLYANYISKKGTQGSEQRRMRVRIFGIVLPTAILLLSPVITILSRLAPLLLSKKFKKEMDYYSSIELRD